MDIIVTAQKFAFMRQDDEWREVEDEKGVYLVPTRPLEDPKFYPQLSKKCRVWNHSTVSIKSLNDE